MESVHEESVTRNIDENTITQAVVESMAGCRDDRLRTVMTSLIQYLHDFASEVRLTESEWAAGIAFLTAAGHLTDDKRQEFILLSDVLGLSTLVTAQNNVKPAGCTEATVFLRHGVRRTFEPHRRLGSPRSGSRTRRNSHGGFVLHIGLRLRVESGPGAIMSGRTTFTHIQ